MKRSVQWLGQRLLETGGLGRVNGSGELWMGRASFSSGGKVEPPQKGLLQRLADSVKEELAKDAKLKEQLKKLQKEKEELSNTEAMQQAREKYKKVELESWKQSDVVKEKAQELISSLRKAAASAAESELGRKALETSKEIADQVGKAAAKVGDTQAAQKVAEGMKIVGAELDSITAAQMYKRPSQLHTRAHFSSSAFAERTFEADTETTTVELHKEARWYTGFKSWYDTSPAVGKMMDWKLKYDESDSRLARLARFFTDGIQSAVHSTTGTDISTVLTEIAKVDPAFDKDEFLHFVSTVIIPHVMEAQVRGEVKVLADWLHEVPFRQLSQPIQQQKELGFDATSSRILDTSRVELLTGKMMEQGPVVIISFSAHVVDVLKNREGKVIQGDPDKVFKINHVWALCRDMQVLDPNAAWKVLEIHTSPAPLAV